MSDAMKNPAGTLGARLDALPLGTWHKTLLFVCFLGVMIENYSQITLPLAMPVIIGQWHLKPFMIGVLISASSLGLVVGALVFGILTDIIGRKRVFILTTVVYSVFAALSAFAADFTQLYVLRVAAGLGLGGFVPVGMAFVSEFSPARYRGRFTAIFSIGNGVVYVLAVLASMFLVPASPEGWRWVLGLGALGLLLVPVIAAALPESVRWLVSRGEIDRAAAIVDQLERRILGAPTMERAAAIAEARASAPSPAGGRSGLAGTRALFGKDLWKHTILAMIVWFVASYTFYGFILWMPSFLTQQMGYELTKGYWFTLVAALVGTGTPALVVGYASDRIGRRRTMSLCMAAYAVFGLVFYWLGGYSILFLYWFSSGMASMTYVYTPELFPNRLRGTGIGFASSVGRFASFIAPMAIGLIVAAGGLFGVLAVNAVLLAGGIAAMRLLGAETKGAGI